MNCIVGSTEPDALKLLGLRVHPSSPILKESRGQDYRAFTVDFYVGFDWSSPLLISLGRTSLHPGWSGQEHCYACRRVFATLRPHAERRALTDSDWAYAVQWDRDENCSHCVRPRLDTVLRSSSRYSLLTIGTHRWSHEDSSWIEALLANDTINPLSLELDLKDLTCSIDRVLGLVG